jgi:hypothetical protein
MAIPTGQLLPLTSVVDFLCFDSLIVEVKALSAIGPIEQAQTLNYLRISAHKRALILNFGAQRLHFRRCVWDRAAPPTDPQPKIESASSASSADNHNGAQRVSSARPSAIFCLNFAM